MRTSRTVAIATAMLVCMVAAPAVGWAQGTQVAVIDVNRVFDQHARFKARMEEVQKDIDQFEAEIRQKQKQLNAMQERVRQYRPGTNEYKAAEQQLASTQAELQVQMSLRRKEFLEREAKVYFTAYHEVVHTVAQFADRHRIGMVLRFNGKKMDPTDRESVLQGVNRAVIYQNRMDITELIIDRLNRGLPPANVGRQQSQIPIRR